MPLDPPQPAYLGDGLYASHDGWHVLLTTGHHDPKQADNVVALDPEVLVAAMSYLQEAVRLRAAILAEEVSGD